MGDNRDFKGIWIPKEIWLNKDLSLNEKVFLVEIDSLDGAEGCFAGNEYFAEFFNLSKTRCSDIINQLAKKEYIAISFIYKNGTKSVQKRILKINKSKYLGIRKTEGGIRKTEGGYSENCKDNNTITNNTINNIISNDIICGTDKSASTVPYELIINMFNSTCKSLPRVKARNKTRDKHIKTMFKKLGIDKIKELFIMTESSDYLSGRNAKWSNCGFDWVIKESNYIKVLEGNYNRQQQGNVIPINSKAKDKHEFSGIKINKEKLGDL